LGLLRKKKSNKTELYINKWPLTTICVSKDGYKFLFRTLRLREENMLIKHEATFNIIIIFLAFKTK